MTSAPPRNGFHEHESETLRAQIASLEARLAGSVAQIEALRQSEARYRHLHRTRIDGFVRVAMDGRIEEANDLFCRMVGYTEDELRSMTYRDLTPSQWHASEDAIIREEVLPRGYSEPYEKEYRRKDGTVFPVEVRTFVVPGQGDEPPIGIAAVVRDITNRKRGLQALHESEEKFRTAFLTSVDAFYIGTLDDGLLIEINPAFERMFGYSREEANGRTSRELGLWANYDDRARMRHQLLANGFVKEMEAVGRRKSGETFEGSISVTALRMQGRDCVIGVVRDITERKAAQAELERTRERLRDLSLRLIDAQEAERARLARELHDDFSQRLALLAVNLHLLGQSWPVGATAPRKALDELYREVQALARDMRRTSHDLHPARLEQLGLVSAMRGLCEDVAAAHGLSIRFDARDVVRDLPEPVALCLYRVAQEALQNVARHSGAMGATVELAAAGSELRLVVTDAGRGFDAAAAPARKALGLASIRERVQAIGGEFVVESGVGRGTRIEVRAPVEGETARS